MKKVMAFGTYDIFHKGHEHFLKYAKSLGDYLIAVVSRDRNIVRIKGKEPVNSETKRLEVISSKEYVDEAFMGYLDDFYRIICEMKPDIVCLGYDQWVKEEDLKQALEKRGMKNVEVVRATSYKPEKYKSSLMKK